jgi:hypothetical protein
MPLLADDPAPFGRWCSLSLSRLPLLPCAARSAVDDRLKSAYGMWSFVALATQGEGYGLSLSGSTRRRSELQLESALVSRELVGPDVMLVTLNSLNVRSKWECFPCSSLPRRRILTAFCRWG